MADVAQGGPGHAISHAVAARAGGLTVVAPGGRGPVFTISAATPWRPRRSVSRQMSRRAAVGTLSRTLPLLEPAVSRQMSRRAAVGTQSRMRSPGSRVAYAPEGMNSAGCEVNDSRQRRRWMPKAAPGTNWHERRRQQATTIPAITVTRSSQTYLRICANGETIRNMTTAAETDATLPGGAELTTDDERQRYAAVSRALADAKRLCVLECLSRGERSVRPAARCRT